MARERQKGARLSLRHGLLGLLAEKPMSGYELTKLFDASLRFVWPAQHSQIYPELARLKEAGLIKQVEEGPRGRKTYAITKRGEKELRRWMLEVEPNRSEHSEFWLRTFFLWRLDPDEAREYLERERAYARKVLGIYEDIAKAIQKGPPPPWGQLPVRGGILQRRAALKWIDEAEEELTELPDTRS